MSIRELQRDALWERTKKRKKKKTLRTDERHDTFVLFVINNYYITVESYYKIDEERNILQNSLRTIENSYPN